MRLLNLQELSVSHNFVYEVKSLRKLEIPQLSELYLGSVSIYKDDNKINEGNSFASLHLTQHISLF